MEPIKQRSDSSRHPTVSHELTDLRAGNIALFAAALAVMIGLVLLVSGWLFDFATLRQAEKQRPLSPLASTRGPAPGPLLQVHAPKDLQEMRAAEDARLNGYGWIDQNAGIVRIPVDRAIDLVAKKGLPVRSEGDSRKQENERR